MLYEQNGPPEFFRNIISEIETNSHAVLCGPDLQYREHLIILSSPFFFIADVKLWRRSAENIKRPKNNKFNSLWRVGLLKIIGQQKLSTEEVLEELLQLKNPAADLILFNLDLFL